MAQRKDAPQRPQSSQRRTEAFFSLVSVTSVVSLFWLRLRLAAFSHLQATESTEKIFAAEQGPAN
jgi:hypothetical protein